MLNPPNAFLEDESIAEYVKAAEVSLLHSGRQWVDPIPSPFAPFWCDVGEYLNLARFQIANTNNPTSVLAIHRGAIFACSSIGNSRQPTRIQF